MTKLEVREARIKILQQCGDDATKAAKIAGVSYRTMNRLQLELGRPKQPYAKQLVEYREPVTHQVKGWVYTVTHQVDGTAHIYVGKSCAKNPCRRWGQHFSGGHRLHEAIRCYGVTAFSWRVVDDSARDKQELGRLEDEEKERWRSRGYKVYNIT